MMNWELFGVFATLALTILGTTYGQFISLRSLIYKMKEDILDKLEYHERHDDTRFSAITNDLNTRLSQFNNDIWQLRLRNVSQDNAMLKKQDVTP